MTFLATFFIGVGFATSPGMLSISPFKTRIISRDF